MVNYLTFTAVGTKSTIYLSNVSNTPNCEYSADGGTTWKSMPINYLQKVSISAGNSIMVRGVNSSGFSKNDSRYSYFVMTGSISASGSIMSLIDGVGETTTIPNSYCFYDLFHDCTKLTTAPALPATTLQSNCYYEMFRGCEALTTPPLILPATTLAEGCYDSMFYDCTKLTTAPALPATTLAEGCYRSMFYDCEMLATPPIISANVLATESCKSMFSKCTSLKVANAPASGYTHFFSCPSSIPSYAVLWMFSQTGGSYKSDPVANGTYYFEGSYPSASKLHVNVSGTWKDATPYVNVSGTWKEVIPYMNVNGNWKETN